MTDKKPPLGKPRERPRHNVMIIDLSRPDAAHPTVVDPTVGAEAARRQRRIDEERSPTIVPDGTEESPHPARQPRRPTVSGVGSPAPTPPAKKK